MKQKHGMKRKINCYKNFICNMDQNGVYLLGNLTADLKIR